MGAITMIASGKDGVGKSTVAALLGDETRRKNMTRAAGAAGAPDAGERIYRVLAELLHNG